jgi:hypothetical protein
MDNQTERVVLETDRHRIVGDLTLPRQGYRARLSDFLNRADLTFIPLVEVEISPTDGGPSETRPFLAVAVSHVQLAYPLKGED